MSTMCPPQTMERQAEALRGGSYFSGIERRHENGALSLVIHDIEPTSPAEWDNLSTMVQRSSRYFDIDSDDEGLWEVWQHFDVYDESPRGLRQRYAAPEFLLRRWERAANSRYNREAMMARYLSIFRPEIHAFDTWAHSEGGHGIVYVTEERRAIMGTPVERCEEVMQAELRTWRDYMDGQVCGVVSLIPEGDVVVTDVDGDTVLGTAFTTEACWGFYPDHDQPWSHEFDYACEEVAGSPVIED